MYKRLQGDSLGCRERHSAAKAEDCRGKGQREGAEDSRSWRTWRKDRQRETGWEEEKKKYVYNGVKTERQTDRQKERKKTKQTYSYSTVKKLAVQETRLR